MAIDTSLETFLLNNIILLDNNSISDDDLIKELCLLLHDKEGINETESIKNSIRELINKYKSKDINNIEFVDSFKTIINNNKRVPVNYTYQSQKPKIEPKVEENPNIVDVDTDIVIETSKELENIENVVSEANIEVPSEIEGYTGGISEIVESSKDTILNSINESKDSMLETLTIIGEIDESINFGIGNGISFKKLSELAYNVKQNSKMEEVTLDFFIKNGCTVDGNMVTLKANGKEYQYDIKRHMFYVNGQEAFETYFYLPSGATDYSRLNTYTCFVENSSNYKNLMNERNSNSAVIKIMKQGTNFNKYSETADATRFMNILAKTDLSSGKCKNVIGGDSVYGTHSLKITAEYPDVYQTVYCVNNAAIVTGENGIRGTKTQFDSLEALKKLDGKEIYFVSVTGDPNLNYGVGPGSGWVNKGMHYEEGYLYTGLKLLCENCPNANVHMVYNENSYSRDKLVELLKELSSKYPNYSYDAAYWNQFADKDYLYHSQGNILVNDLANAGVTNYNVYTA